MRKSVYICDICQKEKPQNEVKKEPILESVIPYLKFFVRDICNDCKKIEQSHDINRRR